MTLSRYLMVTGKSDCQHLLTAAQISSTREIINHLIQGGMAVPFYYIALRLHHTVLKQRFISSGLSEKLSGCAG